MAHDFIHNFAGPETCVFCQFIQGCTVFSGLLTVSKCINNLNHLQRKTQLFETWTSHLHRARLIFFVQIYSGNQITNQKVLVKMELEWLFFKISFHFHCSWFSLLLGIYYCQGKKSSSKIKALSHHSMLDKNCPVGINLLLFMHLAHLLSW